MRRIFLVFFLLPIFLYGQAGNTSVYKRDSLTVFATPAQVKGLISDSNVVKADTNLSNVNKVNARTNLQVYSTSSMDIYLGEKLDKDSLAYYYLKTDVDSIIALYYSKIEVDSIKNLYYTKTESDSIKSLYYLQTEIDSLFGLYYTKTEIDSIKALYYVKTETDSLLNLKLDASVITGYYTDNEVDSLLALYYTQNQIDSIKALYYTIVQSDSIKALYYTKVESDSIKNLYYLKTAVDSLLGLKRDITDSYSASNTDSLLALKRNILDSYSDTEIDSLFNLYKTAHLIDSLLALKQNSLGYTAENSANRVTSLSAGSTDTQYPSAKLAYDQLALKLPVSNPTATGKTTADTLSITTNIILPVNSEQLSATKSLTITDKSYQVLDPNGANRDVNLPNTAVKYGFVIKNNGSAYALVIKDSGATTIVTIFAGESFTLLQVGTNSWIAL